MFRFIRNKPKENNSTCWTSHPEFPEMVSITRDRLTLVCNAYFHAQKTASDWAAPLGIAISLWVLLPISDFKNRLWLSGEQWRVVITMLAIIATCWFLLTAIRALSAPRPTDLIRDIINHADVLEDHRGLYLLKSVDNFNCYRILVYFDIVWNCYLLPHADVRAWDLSDLSEQGPLSTFAARTLGLDPENINVNPVRDAAFKTRKFSEYYSREKTYTFEVIHVEVLKESPHLLEESFTVGGRQYFWKTLGCLVSDPNTAKRNGDVLRYLESHFDAFFAKLPDSIKSKTLF